MLALATDAKPLLTLTMIVKNETHCLRTTLESAKPHIDRWVIVDTGSTDGTPELVQRCMEGIPGELLHAPFVDFATSRNLGLEACGTASTFVLWLDADDILEGGAELRSFLETQREASEEAYTLAVWVAPGMRLDHVRILRSTAGWRFEGAVHENLRPPTGRPPEVVGLEGAACIRRNVGPTGAARTQARLARDVEVLRGMLEADPHDVHTLTHLAKTLQSLRRFDEAVEVYDRCLAVARAPLDRFWCVMGKAACAGLRGAPGAELQALLLEAAKIAPHRAEPLFEIAQYHFEHGRYDKALHFARRAAALPLPHREPLMIAEAVYTHLAADIAAASAAVLGDLTTAHTFAERAYRGCPDEEHAHWLAELQTARTFVNPKVEMIDGRLRVTGQPRTIARGPNRAARRRAAASRGA